MILRPSQPYSQSNLIPILIANPFQPNANPANPLQFQQIIYLTEQTLPSTANHLSQSIFFGHPILYFGGGKAPLGDCLYFAWVETTLGDCLYFARGETPLGDYLLISLLVLRWP